MSDVQEERRGDEGPSSARVNKPKDNNTGGRLRQRRSWHDIEAFRVKNHSLRLSASNVAAMAGFHPYKNLPQLLLDLVYQGGSHLLHADAALLEVSLVTQEQAVMDLATKAGAAKSLQSALQQVKSGKADREKANTLKEKVIQQAASLPVAERKVLQEGIRSAVDTSFGIAHEDRALDWYQERMGSQVRDRNAEIRCWNFAKSGETAVPLGPAKPLHYPKTCTMIDLTTEEESNASLTEQNDPAMCSEPKAAEAGKAASQPTADAKRHDDPKEDETRKRDSNATVVSKTSKSVHPPYFCIMGSVDGLRDELVPGNGNDDDSWILQPVIVECKHRMRRIQPTPPLYEQIQTVVYCQMYQVEEADIVQVLQTHTYSSEDGKKRSSTSATCQESKKPKPTSRKREKELTTQTKLEQCGVQMTKSREGENTENRTNSSMTACDEKTSNVEPKRQQEELPPPIFTVSRVSLDDPLLQHRSSWNTIIVPRLRSFVDAVYRIRRSDDLRYRLLVASDPKDENRRAWELLHQECPWLLECDTAFHRN